MFPDLSSLFRIYFLTAGPPCLNEQGPSAKNLTMCRVFFFKTQQFINVSSKYFHMFTADSDTLEPRSK